MYTLGESSYKQFLLKKLVQSVLNFLHMTLNKFQFVWNVFKGKLYLLDNKKQWIHEVVDKASDKTIIKVFCEYKQRELKKKEEKTEKL